MLDRASIGRLADGIADDIVLNRPFEPHADRVGSDLDLAYRIQDEVASKLQARRPGRTVGGYKIAFNRASSMQYYSLAEPCLAPIFSDQIMASGVALDIGSYRDLVLEVELVATFGRDVGLGDLSSREAISACVESVRSGFELLDPRGAFVHDPTAASAVAQLVYNAGAVIGGPGIDLGSLDAPSLVTRMEHDGSNLGQVIGGAPQDPAEGILWAARAVLSRRKSLNKGMVVLCGTHLPGLSWTARGLVTATMDGIGKAEIVFA